MATPLISNSDIVEKVRNFAILSRILVVILQIISNYSIPDHDAGAFNPPLENQDHDTLLDTLVTVLFSGFRRWDGVYFTLISQYWYTFENCLAFFPIYPLTVYWISQTVFYPLHWLMSGHNVILVSSIMINLFLFVETAKAMFKLGQLVLNNDTIAYKAALLFCINPASIFMTAPYSEMLYMYLTVHGLSLLAKDKNLGTSLFLGLASASRSNGLLNSFYMLYKYFKKSLFSFRNLFRMTGDLPVFSLIWIFLLGVASRCLCLVVSLVPFLLYQYYCYSLYCVGKKEMEVPDHLREYGRNKNLIVQGDGPSEWCDSGVPLAYSYIQKHYWDQGFLHYWHFKQIPNFLIASPAVILVICMACEFYRNNKYVCHTLGLHDEGAMKKEVTDKQKVFKLSGAILLPYVTHAVALTMFGIFFIHVQVLTRLLFSSLPVLYWYTAYLVSPDTPVQVQNRYDIFHKHYKTVEKQENMGTFYHNLLSRQILQFREQSLPTKLVLSYFLGYFFIGTVLFSNFLPWT